VGTETPTRSQDRVIGRVSPSYAGSHHLMLIPHRWRSLIFYLCTGEIRFAPLTSLDSDYRSQWKRVNTRLDSPVPCSPKTIYTLAKRVSSASSYVMSHSVERRPAAYSSKSRHSLLSRSTISKQSLRKRMLLLRPFRGLRPSTFRTTSNPFAGF
jgi:hypothetical protein